MRIHKITKGFTLLEMMVVLAIVSVIMAVVLFGYSAFSQNLSLSSAIQEMSVAIRQAQTYGLSVKESTVGASKFSAGYGLYFTTTATSYRIGYVT
jgi:prepilin-type N-terminal cleavage/methylation domain-containing protein